MNEDGKIERRIGGTNQPIMKICGDRGNGKRGPIVISKPLETSSLYIVTEAMAKQSADNGYR